MSDHRIAMLGLPKTGKSTFLGALWHFVEEPSIDEIKETDIEGSRKHLQELASNVRSLTEIARTHHDGDERFEVDVEFAGRGTVKLVIPDRSGEQLQGLIERRQWPELLRDELAVATGLMLFVNPDEHNPPLELYVAPGAGPTLDGPAEYTNHGACTSAQLIDGLENVIEAMSSRWPLRVAVVISAFDRVEKATPEAWIEKRLPAIASLLETNSARIKGAVFGVSAQGGRREDSESVLQLGELHERAWARSANGTVVRFSEPVRWALGW
jgi:Double-GTPase 1